MFNNPGDLRVGAVRLQIIYAPLSAPHRTAVLERLCEEMTKRQKLRPGTRLTKDSSVKNTA